MAEHEQGGLAAFVAAGGVGETPAVLSREMMEPLIGAMRAHGEARIQAESYRQNAEMWRARYMAAHEILLLVEAYIERMESPGVTVDLYGFAKLRDAFLAYRATIEAGAPLRWAVLEQEVAG